MRGKDLKENEVYRLKSSPNYGYVKFLKLLKAKEGVNTNTYQVAKVEHSTDTDFTFGFIRYFRPSDLIVNPQ